MTDPDPSGLVNARVLRIEPYGELYPAYAAVVVSFDGSNTAHAMLPARWEEVENLQPGDSTVLRLTVS